MTVVDRDRGARALTRRLTAMEASGPFGVTVGVHEDVGAKPHDPVGAATIGDVARFVEFGTERTPAQSFLRVTVESEKRRVERKLAQAAERVARGRAHPEVAVGAVGEELAAKMKARAPSETGALAGAIEARFHTGREGGGA